MRGPGRAVAGLLLALAPASVGAQASSGLGPAVIAVGSEPWFVGGGLAGVVPVGDLIRIGALAAVGRRGDATEGRAELSLQLAFDQSLQRRRASWYLGGGLAGRTGADRQGYVLAVAGLEGRSGRSGRWWVETGIGGGVRLAAGYRWHRATKSGRPPR